MTVKIKVNKKTHAIESIKGNIGEIAQDRAAELFHRHEVEPTTGYKLRRFCRRLYLTLCAKFDEAAAIATAPYVPADEVPFIGMLEEHV